MAEIPLLEDTMATSLPQIELTTSANSLSEDALGRLEDIAQKHGWSLEGAMRRALDITELVLDAKDADPNSKVYVYRDGKRYSLELKN